MHQQSTWDEMDEDELDFEVRKRGWTPEFTAQSTYGVEVTFRKQPTSNGLEASTHKCFGDDEAGAMRELLKALENNRKE